MVNVDRTLNMSIADLKRSITKKTKAIGCMKTGGTTGFNLYYSHLRLYI